MYSSAIVRGSRYAVPAFRNIISPPNVHRRFQQAQRIYDGARRYTPYARGAARTIGRAYRRYRARAQARRPPGEEPGVRNTKRNENISSNQQLFAGTLAFYEPTAISGTTTNEIYARQRDLIRITGLKIDLEYRNNNSTPMYMNIAVVSLKNTTTIATPNFFRKYGSTRGVDFGDTSLGAIDYHRLPINTDIYNVLSHKRFVIRGYDLENAPQFSLNSGGTNYGVHSEYININRQFRYVNATSTRSQTPIYICMWVATFLDPPPVTAGTVPLQFSLRHTLHFRETQDM